MFDPELFDDARREFLSHLLYAKGHSQRTCYNYNSDLGIWANWLIEAGKDWQACRYPDVEQFAAWQLRDRGVSAHIVNRRLSALSFYKWLMRSGIVDHDPVALAEKPKRPLRIPVWLEREEQAAFEATLKDRRNIPINIFGNNKTKMTETRRRYEMLFGLLLNSGLRISEALRMKVADVRIVEGIAKSVRVTGKGNKERLVPLPGQFAQVFGFWLKDRENRSEPVFAKADGKAVSPQAARRYLRLMLEKAGIDKKISPHKLRHTYATNLLNAGAELVDIKALLGHESIATTQIYTNVGQERMEKVVSKL